MTRRSNASGMTLLEMLVVLIIAGMAIALGFQSLGQWRRADAAISSLTSQNREMMLVRSWLQGSIRALYPVPETEFKGDQSGWTGVTLQPVLHIQGGATEASWVLVPEDGKLVLRIDESGDGLSLPTDAVEALFEYIDSTGRGHPQWPPALGQHDHLPSAIVLRLETSAGAQRLWGASIAGIRNPVPILYESETD